MSNYAFSACLLLLTSCMTWRLQPQGLEPDLPPYERRQIWVRDLPAVLHGIELRGDTMRGVPVPQSYDCERCALYWPRSAIDSVRTPATSWGRTLLLVGIAGLGTSLWVIVDGGR